MKTFIRDCTDAELAKVEQEWQGLGYKFVNKENPRELAVGEYMKAANRSSAKSFGGKNVWLLTRREAT